MNENEWSKQPNRQQTYEYKYVHKLLSEWQQKNQITERCIVHHRDDNDEVRLYNKNYYERWGFNEDGTFEYGKYVIFMTISEHSRYHNTGEKNPFYGKTHNEETKRKISETMTRILCSEEVKRKMSEAKKGKKLSDEHRQKMSAAHTGEKNSMYGQQHTHETKRKISEARKQYCKAVRDLYTLYQELRPESKMTFSEFQKSLR